MCPPPCKETHTSTHPHTDRPIKSKSIKHLQDKARSKSSSTAAIAAPEQLQEQREQQPAEEVGGDAAPAPVPLESQVAADAVTDVVAAGAEEQA